MCIARQSDFELFDQNDCENDPRRVATTCSADMYACLFARVQSEPFDSYAEGTHDPHSRLALLSGFRECQEVRIELVRVRDRQPV